MLTVGPGEGRAQIDQKLLAMRRRVVELEREHARLDEARRRGEVGARALLEIREEQEALNQEIARLEAVVLEVEADTAAVDDPLDRLIVASLQTSGELDRLRTEILDALRALAEPLTRYGHLGERQRLLTARLRELTGKDNSYAAYIDTALLRAGDYDDALRHAVETIKGARVVA